MRYNNNMQFEKSNKKNGHEQNKTPEDTSSEAIELGADKPDDTKKNRWNKMKRVMGGAAVVLALGGGFAYMGYEMGNSMHDSVSGTVTSVEHVGEMPGKYGTVNDYFAVTFTTPEGKEITAYCAEGLCEGVDVGETIEANISKLEDSQDGRQYLSTSGGHPSITVDSE